MSKPYVKYFDSNVAAEKWLMNAGYQVNTKETTSSKFVYDKKEDKGEIKRATVERTSKGYKSTIVTV